MPFDSAFRNFYPQRTDTFIFPLGVAVRRLTEVIASMVAQRYVDTSLCLGYPVSMRKIAIARL